MDCNIQPYVHMNFERLFVNILTASMTMSISRFAVMAKLETLRKLSFWNTEVDNCKLPNTADIVNRITRAEKCLNSRTTRKDWVTTSPKSMTALAVTSPYTIY